MKNFLLCCLLAPLFAWGQAYALKPIRMIVPFPTGGPADIFGRGLAQRMSVELGQPVIVENVVGLGYVIGVGRALNTLVARVPEVPAVHLLLPAASVCKLVEYARKSPGKVNFGSAAGGSIAHLAGELLKAEAKIDLVPVPYKGAGPAVNDLVAGQVQMGVFDVPVLLGHIKSGRLKALAVTSATRALALPEVPTTAEAGCASVTSDNWYGLAAPGTPQQYAAFLAAEQAKWSKLVTAIGFKEQN